MAGAGFLYLAVWMDLYCIRVIGRQLAEHIRKEPIAEAFKKAMVSRSPKQQVIVHSDQGGQYAGSKFRKLITGSKWLQSISRANNPYDNASMESCFSRFKAELLQGGTFQTNEDAQTEILEFIEMYCITKRRHSALNY